MAPLVEVISYGASCSRLENKIRNALSQALLFLNKKDVFVEVSLLSDEQMQQANAKSRNKDGVATVLSFPETTEMPASPNYPQPLGEILLAPDFIDSQGGDLIALAIHGLLHLLGYTHSKQNDTIEMQTLEEKILNQLETNDYNRP